MSKTEIFSVTLSGFFHLTKIGKIPEGREEREERNKKKEMGRRKN